MPNDLTSSTYFNDRPSPSFPEIVASANEDVPTRRLLDVVEECEDPLPQHLRRTLVVVREALVRKQVAVARVEEQLGAVDCLRELACGGRSSSAQGSSSIM